MLFLYCLLIVSTPVFGEYLASITIQEGHWKYFVEAAVIINNRFLVTGAHHLAQKKPQDLHVHVGTGEPINAPHIHEVEAYILHPLFDLRNDRYKNDTKNDIAIVFLSKDLPIGNGQVDSLQLPSVPSQYEGETANALSWSKDGKLPKYKTVPIVIQKRVDCQINHRDVDCNKNFWAISSDCDLKYGDPVVLNDKVIGIVSDNKWCKGSGNIFVTNLSQYIKWFNNVQNENL